MEHELWIDGEVICQPEARRVLLPVIGELLAQPDKHPVQPPQHVRAVVDLSLKYCNTGHEHGSRFLVEAGRNTGASCLCKVSRDGRDS